MDALKKLYQLQGKAFLSVALQAALLNDKDQKVFFVDSVHGSDSYGGRTITSPFATLAAAYAACTANNHDVIVVLPRHAETVTSVLTIAKAGVSIIGLKCGNLRPTITGNAAIDAISITAANVTISGLRFAAPETDAQTADINVAAAFAHISDTIHIGSKTALNKVDIITLASGADDCLIEDVRIYNDTVECVGGIAIEAAITRLEIRNCFIMDSVGFTNGAIYDGATALNVYIHNNVFSNAKADTVVMEFGNNTTGVCSFNHVNGRHTTLASNVSAGTGMAFFENRVVEEAALNGAIIPAADSD